MLLLLARFETAKFFQDGDISVPLIPKDLLDDCCCCCSLLTLLDPCLSTSPTKEDIPLRDLQPFKGWYSSPLMFPVPGGFVSHVVMTFVKLLLLLLILPFKLVDDIGIPLSSDMLLLVVLNKNESKCYAFDIDENSMIFKNMFAKQTINYNYPSADVLSPSPPVVDKQSSAGSSSADAFFCCSMEKNRCR